MADEQNPPPDGIVPKVPPRPQSAFPKDVIYSAAQTAKPMVTPVAVDSVTDLAGKGGTSAAKLDRQTGEVSLRRRSEIVMFFSWIAGLFLIIIFGWGQIGFWCFLAKKCGVNVPIELVGIIGIVPSFMFLFLLERKLWLSRFMGLRLGPTSTPLKEALFFTFFGVAGLLLRSSEETASEARAAPEADGVREVVETVVFVVVLVLLLKTFLVEAFVIPTGSMAETLYGYYKQCTCEKCGYQFPVNCSSEAEPQQGREKVFVEGAYCPNCHHPNRFP